MQGSSRRAFIRGALCGAFAGAWHARAPAQREARRRLVVTRLAPGVAMIAGSGGNVVAARVDGGIVMVDGGAAADSQEIVQAVSETFGTLPVRFLVNTHWHPEQTGSNAALARAGARILAHANTRLWLETDVRRPWEDFAHAPLPAEALPRLVFHESSRELGLGHVAFECGYMLQAHTDGDVFVRLPRANVLCAGGVIASDRWPLVDWWTGGWLGGLVEGVETLLQVADDETIIVPSHGPPLRRRELAAQRDIYAELFVRFRDELLFKGLGPAEAVAARPTEDHHPEWPNRDEFVALAFQSLWGFYAPDV